MFTFIQTYKLQIALIVAVVLLFGSLKLFAASPTLSPQQKAAAELQTVLETIEETRPAYERHRDALNRQAQLVSCIMDNVCPFGTGATLAQ